MTLSSFNLVKALISAKIKRKKFHTVDINSNFFAAAGLKETLPTSLININEYLFHAVHSLKLRALTKANDKQDGLFPSVRNECLYVRNNQDVPQLIFSEQDLDDFLEQISLSTTQTAS